MGNWALGMGNWALGIEHWALGRKLAQAIGLRRALVVISYYHQQITTNK
jgi:hypothetical protein